MSNFLEAYQLAKISTCTHRNKYAHSLKCLRVLTFLKLLHRHKKKGYRELIIAIALFKLLDFTLY